jgi:dTDP-4-dehydrorhamnose 3,5-epimerase
MQVRELEISGLLEIRPAVFRDNRGYFFESFNEEAFRAAGIESRFVQDNQSFSRSGVIRGLHFQNPPYEQGKLVRVITGHVLDVVVDIRKASPTYGQRVEVELHEEDPRFIYIPPGFAHGFSVLKDSVFHYKCTQGYQKSSESGIHPTDPDLNIDWRVSPALISEKDLELPPFSRLSSPF